MYVSTFGYLNDNNFPKIINSVHKTELEAKKWLNDMIIIYVDNNYKNMSYLFFEPIAISVGMDRFKIKAFQSLPSDNNVYFDGNYLLFYGSDLSVDGDILFSKLVKCVHVDDLLTCITDWNTHFISSFNKMKNKWIIAKYEKVCLIND